jgi:hypothetical protein
MRPLCEYEVHVHKNHEGSFIFIFSDWSCSTFYCSYIWMNLCLYKTRLKGLHWGFLTWRDQKYFFQDFCITRCMSRPITRVQNFKSFALTLFPRNNQFCCENWPNKWKPFKRFSLKPAINSIQSIINLIPCIFIYHLLLGFKFKCTSWFRKNFKIHYFRLLDLSGVPLSFVTESNISCFKPSLTLTVVLMTWNVTSLF